MFYLSITENFEVSILPCIIICEGNKAAIIEIEDIEYIVKAERLFVEREDAVKGALQIINDSIMKLHKLADTLSWELF